MKKVRVRKSKLRSFRARYTFVATVVLPPLDALDPCPSKAALYNMCVYATSTAKVFTGENQLGPAIYTKDSETITWGLYSWAAKCSGLGSPEKTCQFPTAFPSTTEGIYAQYQSSSQSFFGGGVDVSASYAGPSPMPANDVVMLNPEIPVVGKNTAGFTNGEYTGVSTSKASGYDDVNFIYEITNYPFIVKIKNNLSDTGVKLDGDAPALGGFVSDPTGGKPTPIAKSETGYFGMYRNVAGANSFSASYDVTDVSSKYYGGSFLMSAVFKNGKMDPTSTCTYAVSVASEVAYCDLTFIGGPQATQTLNIDLHE
jgi:hypothetical protein